MIVPKKSLGQNFLTDRNVLDKITNIVSIRNKYVLEIGPGTGNLSSFILKKNPKKLIGIEKDNLLAKNFKPSGLIINYATHSKSVSLRLASVVYVGTFASATKGTFLTTKGLLSDSNFIRLATGTPLLI